MPPGNSLPKHPRTARASRPSLAISTAQFVTYHKIISSDPSEDPERADGTRALARIVRLLQHQSKILITQ